MFANLRLGLAARLPRSPVFLALLRIKSLSTPATLAYRTFLNSARVSESATVKATEKVTKASKPAAKKKPAARKPKKEKAPKIDRKLLKPPKRPASPFISYCAENSDGNSKTLPEANAACVEHAVKWRALPENVREDYSKRFRVQLQDYHKEYERWYNSLTAEQLKEAKRLRQKGKKKLTIVPPGEQPRRPVNAYLQFLQDYRKERGAVGFEGAITKQAAEAWKALPESEKNAYKQRYVGALEQYHKDFKAYKQQFSPDAQREMV
ncbi:hypothetical protein L218DRAFT_1079981 [Marasmius fiardii PR-910]|nr:hypothetical protein L218DRAFT_1079981 [Marasmius fiardii PR-910]